MIWMDKMISLPVPVNSEELGAYLKILEHRIPFLPAPENEDFFFLEKLFRLSSRKNHQNSSSIKSDYIVTYSDAIIQKWRV